MSKKADVAAKKGKVEVEDSSSEEEVIKPLQKKVKLNNGSATNGAPTTDNTKVGNKLKNKEKLAKKDDSDDESAEEKPTAKNGKAQKPAATKPVAKKGAKGGDDTSETSEDEDLGKELAGKKNTKQAPAAKTNTKAQAGKNKMEVESEDDSEDDAAAKAKAKGKGKTPATTAKTQTQQKPAVTKGKATVQDDDDDDDDDEEDEKSTTKKPTKAEPPKTQKPGVKKPQAKDSDDDDDDEEETTTKKPASKIQDKKPALKKVQQEEEEDDETPAPKKGGKTQAGGDTNGKYEAFVNGLSFQASETDVKQHFSEYGTVESVNLLKGYDGKSKGIAFVRFNDEESLAAALEADGTEILGRTIHVEKTVPKEQRAGGQGGAQGGAGQRPKSAQDPNSSTVFVGNLSYNSTEETIKKHFAKCGNIIGVRVARDQDGNMRGFGHVDFDAPEACQSAVELAGSMLDGRAINVDFAGAKKSGGGFGGGFGGRDGGGFRGGRGGGRGGRGGPRGGRGGFLDDDDKNAKKGAIGQFQGQKKKL